MDGKERYKIYREMQETAYSLESILTERLQDKGYKVYTMYIAVSIEETRTYFIDIEYGNDTPGGYHRHYRTITENKLEKAFL